MDKRIENLEKLIESLCSDLDIMYLEIKSLKSKLDKLEDKVPIRTEDWYQ